jgi:putative hemolysin
MATAVFDSILPNIVPFPVPRRLQTLLNRLVGIDEFARVYQQIRNKPGCIADGLLDFLNISFVAAKSDLEHIPANGPAIVTVNHPHGILDGAILASLLTKIRPDVRFLGNHILTWIPELRDLIIPVDLHARANTGATRRSIAHLRGGGVLVIFPAGEVSHFRLRERSVSEGTWNPIVGRLATLVHAPVVPVHIAGSNGPSFHIAGLAHPALRTILLCRELLNKRGRTIDVRIGSPIVSEKLLSIPSAREQADYLRWRTSLLGNRESFKPRTALPLHRHARPAAEPIAAPVPASTLATEIEALAGECLLNRSGDLEVYLAQATQIPNVLRELGRLREISFRAVGEGTHKCLDLDQFDNHYLHLFVWNARVRELVGAYRLATTDTVLRAHGIPGLYTATLFEYGDSFLERIGPAVELGRSFVRQEYQKGFAPLLLLWKGIGAFIARNPRYKILFGPVSISNQYQAISRELMISFLEKYAYVGDLGCLVRNRHHVKRAYHTALPQTGFNLDDLSALVSDIEQKQTGVPVLLRQYLKLGGKLLGFNVDPRFSNALDGLILVDLTKTDTKLLQRYLGKTEAQTFLEFQKGNTPDAPH